MYYVHVLAAPHLTSRVYVFCLPQDCPSFSIRLQDISTLLIVWFQLRRDCRNKSIVSKCDKTKRQSEVGKTSACWPAGNCVTRNADPVLAWRGVLSSPDPAIQAGSGRDSALLQVETAGPAAHQSPACSLPSTTRPSAALGSPGPGYKRGAGRRAPSRVRDPEAGTAAETRTRRPR